MKKNMGVRDKALRSLAAAVIVLLIMTGRLQGIAAWILGILAALLIITAYLRFCGLYALLGISTVKKHPGEPE